MTRDSELSIHLFDFDPGQPPPPDAPEAESLDEYGAQPDWLCGEENVIPIGTAWEQRAREKIQPRDKTELVWSDWPIVDGKVPAPVLANVTAALDHAPALAGLIGPGLMLTRRPPWDHGAGPWIERELGSADTTRLTELLQRSGLRVGPSVVRDAIAGVGALVPDGALEAGGEPFLSAADLLGRPLKPRSWVVADMIPAGQPTEIRGDGGLGKSTLGLQLAVAVVSGTPWLGQPTIRGPAIYLAGEDDLDEIHRRLDAIATHAGLAVETLADLHVWPLAAEDPALAEGGERGKLAPTRRWHELATKVGAVRAAVVILDSRADVFGGSEIDRAQVRQFVGMQRKLAVATGAAVVTLAHPSLTGMASRSGNSGSTHWGNAVRSALYLSRPESEGHADPDARALAVVKANYAPAGGKLALRWTIGGFVVEEGPSGGSRPQSRQEAEKEADQAFLTLLVTAERRGIRVSARPGTTYAPALFTREPGANGLSKRVLEQAMNRLLDRGRIEIREDGPPSRRRSFLTFSDVSSD